MAGLTDPTEYSPRIDAWRDTNMSEIEANLSEIEVLMFSR